VSALLDGGAGASLAELLDALPAYHETGRDIWRRLASPGTVRRLLVEPVDFKTLDRLLPRLDLTSIEPLLDTLADSPNRATRRGLLDRLAQAPVELGAMLVARMADPRWYVQRNMLVLLDALPALPAGFSAAPHATHPDWRIRREALKVRLKAPEEREVALEMALDDPEPQVVQLALIAVQQRCSPPVATVLVRRLAARTLGPELRLGAIKALGRSHAPEALEALLGLTDGGRSWLGQRRLLPKSPELVAALLALSSGWSRHPRARSLLAFAGRSADPEIRAAAGLAVAR
jgi:hypothetical protein